MGRTIIFSPDSRYAVVGDARGAEIFELEAGTPHSEFESEYGLSAIVFSPDARYAAVAENNGQIWVYESATGTRKAEFYYAHSAVLKMMFSLDGSRISVAFSDHKARLFNINAPLPIVRHKLSNL